MKKLLVIKQEDKCERCGSYTYEVREKGPHIGLYCKCCGKYIKWLSKKEKEQYGIIAIETKKSSNDVDVEKNEHRKDYEKTLEDELPW